MWFPVFGPEVTFQNYHFYKKLQKKIIELKNKKNTLESPNVKNCKMQACRKMWSNKRGN